MGHKGQTDKQNRRSSRWLFLTMLLVAADTVVAACSSAPPPRPTSTSTSTLAPVDLTGTVTGIYAGLGIQGANTRIRPWLQDFTLGTIHTTATVKARMQAASDFGTSSWMPWNAANIYSREALQQDS